MSEMKDVRVKALQDAVDALKPAAEATGGHFTVALEKVQGLLDEAIAAIEPAPKPAGGEWPHGSCELSDDIPCNPFDCCEICQVPGAGKHAIPKPAGGEWVTVPREPTEAMKERVRGHGGAQALAFAMAAWPDMLAAAPPAPAALEPAPKPAGGEFTAHTVAEFGRCGGHEWISTRDRCQCRKCKAVMIDGEAYYPASKIADIAEAVFAAAPPAASPSGGEVEPAEIPPMPPTTDREPFDDDLPGYGESDKDWMRHDDNALAVQWLIDNHVAIRSALTSPEAPQASEVVREATYPIEVIKAAVRIKEILDGGCDRGERDDFELLERHGLMDQAVCSDTFGQDTLEIGETMWTFNAAGEALCAALAKIGGANHGK